MIRAALLKRLFVFLFTLYTNTLFSNSQNLEFTTLESGRVLIKRSLDGMSMTSIPPSEFFFGSQEPLHDHGEKPSILVKMNSFWIDRFEISQRQYAICQNSGACPKPGSLADTDSTKTSLPMVSLNWTEARSYCQWAGMDLPTEAQWEFASRGNLSMTYPWGNSVFPSASLSNPSFGISFPRPISAPHSAASTKVDDLSSMGIYHLGGNVSEWTLDSAAVNEKGEIRRRVLNESEEKHRKSENFFSGSSSSYRVVKGANFRIRFPAFQRGSYRRAEKEDFRSDSLGFRCARWSSSSH